MGEGVAHIISPLSAPWCGWVLLGLFICAFLSEFFQPGVITQASESLRFRIGRTYKDSPVTFAGQTLITLFRLGTLALALCLFFSPAGHFSFAAYMAVNGIILALLLVKMFWNVLIDYTFQLSRHYGPAYEHYSNIATLVCVILWPVVLVLCHVSNPAVIRWSLGIIAALFFAILLYRGVAHYLRSPMALVYLVLYACTLELLPATALIYTSEKLISTL